MLVMYGNGFNMSPADIEAMPACLTFIQNQPASVQFSPVLMIDIHALLSISLAWAMMARI